MQSEIGSNFWLSPEDMITRGNILPSPEIFSCIGSDYVWLSTCRSAIKFVIETIERQNPYIRKVAYLPSFTCHTVYEPFFQCGYRVITYPVNRNLTSNIQDILKVLGQVDGGIILFHRYFGFNTLPNIDTLLPLFRERNVTIIEDCTQSLYSGFERLDADYFVGSIRKWCGVPDGGFAVCKKGVFLDKPTKSDIMLEQAKREASEMKYQYLFLYKGLKDEYLVRYKEAEDILNNQNQYYTMSELSKIVQSNLDIHEIKAKRRKNFQTLLRIFKNMEDVISVFDILGDEDVPLYFPILCDDRTKVQKLLQKNAVYAPIVWPKAEICPNINDDAQYLYEHLLCIPLDQRYDEYDMNRVGYIMKDSEIRCGWMNWEDICPYKEQLIQLEHELMIRYHYPDKSISVVYPSSRVKNMETYMALGNTFFWAACRGNELLGYMWCYISPFIDDKRWNIRSIMFKTSVQSLGLGRVALKAGEEKALELGCTEMCTEYVPSNDHMSYVMKKEGFAVTRIEVVKQLK